MATKQERKENIRFLKALLQPRETPQSLRAEATGYRASAEALIQLAKEKEQEADDLEDVMRVNERALTRIKR